MFERLVEYVTSERFSTEVFNAKTEYLKVAGEMFEDDKSFENHMTAFLEWYVLDRTLSGKTITPLELFIEENRDSLSAEQLRVYEDFLRSIHGLFEIKKIKGDVVIVNNFLDQNKYTIHENEENIFFKKNDLFEGRVMPYHQKFYFTGTFCYHPEDAHKFIKTEAKKLIKDKERLEKTLKQMNSELLVIDSNLRKMYAEAEKMKSKVDKSGRIHSDSYLEFQLKEIENKQTILENQRTEKQQQIAVWELNKIKLGCRQSREHLIQRLSYMKLKWERSRQIAVKDIYRNA